MTFSINIRKSSLFAISALCIGGLSMTSCTEGNNPAGGAVAPVVEEPSSLKVGLSAHWDFNGNANDKSKYGNNGAVIGATPTEDRFGQANGAFSFDGIDDYVQFGNITFLSWGGYDKYTMSAWVKPSGDGGQIVSKFNGGVSAGWFLSVTSDMHASTYRNVTPWSTKSLDPVTEGKWCHLIAMYDGSDLFIYIDGELQQQQTFRSQPNDFETPVLVGARYSQNNPGSFFSGVIDDVRLYSRDLSVEEIEWLANN